MSDYFYGWYFRCQGRDGSIAVIPAVHLSAEKRTCSIQLITQKGSLYREFPVSRFRINREKGIMKIGENLFSRKGIYLKFTTPESEEISGSLRFGRFAELKYDIMGPFSYIPGMECRHAVYSMKHTVNGEIRVNEQIMRFKNDMGYIEGDSGTSFPDRYIWTQHFIPEGSVMLAAATVPLAGIRLTGTVGFLFYRNREYRFATYLGTSVVKMGERELMIRQGRYRLHVRFHKNKGSLLNAPESGQMTRRVREDIACHAEYTLMYGNRVLLHTVTNSAAAEYDTKEEKNENNSYHSRKDKRKIFKRRYRRIQQAAEPLL